VVKRVVEREPSERYMRRRIHACVTCGEESGKKRAVRETYYTGKRDLVYRQKRPLV
jgi:hypothetical protein